ncbi:MAG: prephenate/arogenate dehydrogenase family protein [Pseudomonadota bacterium]|nr:prephenate/arogenate dehydrogenase family protein [Pseudomonadota bacterium]
MARPVFERVTIIGAGLIGSSIALAAREFKAAKTVTLYDRDEDVRRRARSLDLGDVAETLEAACAGSDCVILCVPVGAIAETTKAIASFLKQGAVLTDVGSVKEKALEAMQASCPAGIHLVPGHPIAGTEKSGPEAGFATLFRKAWHILTPLPQQEEPYNAAVDRLASFWEMLGSRVEIMEATRHDRVLAITSHLPHLIAFNIVSTAYDMESVAEGEVVKYSAGGFRDFTRIAASDPTMWRDVFLNNKDAVLETLGRFSEDLAALQRAIRWGDGEMLMREFERARGIRKAIIEAGQDTEEANFGRNRPADDKQD